MRSVGELLSTGAADEIDFDFSWSSLLEPPPSGFAGPVRLTRDSVSVIEAILEGIEAPPDGVEATPRLEERLPARRQPPPEITEWVQFTGPVVTLTRSRRATIRAEIFGRQRSVYVWLSEDEHQDAANALAHDLDVSVSGAVRLRPSTVVRLIELERFEVMRDESD